MSNTLVGRSMGDYRLEAVIGAGNLGTVYQATSKRDNSSAALKIVHDTLTGDPGFPDRFRGVAGAAAALRHPNVVRIYGVGNEGEEYFIAMELLARGSLRTMLERRDDRPSLARVVDLIRQAAEALGYAHSQGVVHRDVKPENIMLARADASAGAGTVRVVDFGMMQLIDTGVTMVGRNAPGSPRYMSPEQCAGRPPEPRSDIYSLGVVLYEAATGYPPFQVNTMAEAIDKHLSATPASPRSVNSAIPAELERVILRCLAKKADDRYSSAYDVGRDLSALELTLKAQNRRIVMEGSAGAANVPRDVATPGGQKKIRIRLEGDEDAPSPRDARQASTPVGGGVVPGDKIRVKLPQSDEQKRERAKAKEPAAQAAPARAAESKLIKISIDRQLVTLIPGQPTVLRATIFNGGKIVDHFQFAVEGVPANWVQLPPSPPQLNPGDRAAVNITVNVPRIPESVARIYNVIIRVTAMRQSTEMATCVGEWTVTPFVNSVITLAPSRARAWTRAGYGIKFRNDGNAPARYELVANDDEAVLKYRFGETVVSLGPGDSTQLSVDVRSKTRWIGATEARTFMIRANPVPALDGTPPIVQTPPVAPGQYLHRAIIPLWLPPLLLLLALGLWFWWSRRTQFQLAVTPTRVAVSVGSSAPIKAAVTNVKGEAVDSLAKQVRWTVDDTTIAKMNDSGMVHGLKAGTTVMTASVLKRTQTVEVSVTAAQVASLVIAPPQAGLIVGGRAAFRTTIKDENGATLKRDVQWMSSNPMVASVANGTVVASDTGVATITAMSEGKTATAMVMVRPNAAMLDAIKKAAAAAAGAGEDCIAYDPAALKVVRDKLIGFLVSDGSNTVATLDDELDAKHTVQLAKGYRKHCYLGRNNKRPNRSSYVLEYWNEPTGVPVVVENAECTPYSATALKVNPVQTGGFALLDGKRTVLLADTQDDATKIWQYAQRHTSQCFIGRGNSRQNQRDYIVQYWR